jgi:hypothetical protein
MPISERRPLQAGSVTGRAVAKDEAHIAVATAATSCMVVGANPLDREEIGERLSLRFHQAVHRSTTDPVEDFDTLVASSAKFERIALSTLSSSRAAIWGLSVLSQNPALGVSFMSASNTVS